MLIENISIQLPRERILRRLGYSPAQNQLSASLRAELELMMREAFDCCVFRGVWQRQRITAKELPKITIEANICFESHDFYKFASAYDSLLLFAATAGPEIVEAAVGHARAGRGAAALVYDAVGGECVDLALKKISDMVGSQLSREGRSVSKKRYSAGYGDLNLSVQRDIFDLLDLNGSLGLRITESLMLIPEKSVIAIAGINNASKFD